MATYYKYLDNRSKTAKKFPLKIAISHRKKTRYIATGYYLSDKEWDGEKEKIQPPFKNSGSANAKVNRRYAIVGEVIESLRPYFKQLNVDQIKAAVEQAIDEEFKKKTESEVPKIVDTALHSEASDLTCFYAYTKDVAKRFYVSDRGGSARVMENMVRSLKAFTAKDSLPFKQITVDFLNAYETWYLKQFNSRGKKNSINGLGFNAREIRRIYNFAIKDENVEVTQEMYPFGRYGYSIKREKTDNKNIDPAQVAKLFQLRLAPGTKLWHHLNYFKYCFECWGMNFMDLAHLRVYQVENGRLKYRRRKTRWSNNAKKFDIEHSPIAQKIIDYYIRGKKASDFVFPILDDIFYLNHDLEDKDEEARNKKLFERKLGDRRCNHIRRLKTISKKAGLENTISIYVGRHSFFSIALRNGISKSEISEMAGHSNYQVTENYLAGFNGEQLTENAKVVRNAVAYYTEKKTNRLHDEIILSGTKKVQTVSDFLTEHWQNASTEERNTTYLVIALLQKTDCKDGIKAQEYVNCFLQSQEELHYI